MKRSVLMCVVLLFSISLWAQEKKEVNVSDKIKAEFTKLYPNAGNVKWSKDFENTRAMFYEKGKQIAVVFKADTLFMKMIETEIADLPEKVKNHLVKYYKDFRIVRAGKIYFSANPAKNNVCYGADVTDGSITKRVICYPSGDEFMVSTVPDEKKE
ncbi:MAG: hypothetical protein NTX65_15885 [Ignavibacteriales bacterium]|nr:hypothetical protein [Ignavibacteriales bacterium]